jgi:predicted phage tail protein
LRPGDVVKIQDKLKNLKRYGGRIKDIDYAGKSVTLDEGIDQDIVNQKITFIVPKANSTVRELNKTAAAKLKIAVENQEVNDGISMSEIDSTREPQIKQFTISSVSETNVVSVAETSDQDFNLIKKGFIWSVQNTTSAYEIEEVEYRVLSVVEQSFNQYQITGMMYNRSKFAAIDESKNLERTQQSKTSLIEVGSITLLPSGDDSLQSYGNDPLVDIVPIQITDGQSIVPEFNARFINNNGELINGEIETYMKLDFSQLAIDNKVSAENTGGYVVDVYKDSGDKVRFTLDGHDQTEAQVLIGSEKEAHNLTVEIFRYDAAKKINSGAPAP